jgi:hypothetical protein
MKTAQKVSAGLLVTAMLAGGVYFLGSQVQKASSGPTLLQLAQETPKGAFMWVGVEMQDKLTGKTLAEPIAKLRKSAADVDSKLKELETQLGKPLDELLQQYKASGFVAVYPREGRDNLLPEGDQSPVEVLLAVRVADAQGIEALLKSKLQNFQSQDYAGKKLQTDANKFGWSIHDDFLVLASDPEHLLKRSIDVHSKPQDSLSRDPHFAEAVTKIPGLKDSPNGVGAYVDYAPIWTTVEKLGDKEIDDTTIKGLKTLSWGASVTSKHSGQWGTDGFMSIDSKSDSKFAKALLATPQNSHSLLKLVPQSWGYAQDGQLFYCYDAILELVSLFPKGRTALLGMFALELAPGGTREQQLRNGFSGEVVSATDLDSLVAGVQTGFGQARQSGQTTACKSNLKNIATACEMYSTDNAGRYPTDIKQLAPEYLKTVPTCPSSSSAYSFESTKIPDLYTITCQGDPHQLGKGLPSYNAIQGLITGSSDVAAQPAETSPQPKSAVILGIQDAEKVKALLAPLMIGAQTEKLEGLEASVLRVGATELRLVYLENPKALIILPGPGGAASLKQIVACSKGEEKSLQSVSQLSDFTSKKGSKSIALGYTDMSRLKPFLEKFLENQPAREAFQPLLDEKLGLLSPSFTSAQIEADGMRFSAQGSPLLSTGALAVGAAILLPNFIHARSQGQLTACKSNEKNIATALEMWSSDNSGRYPQSLKQLTPNYLRTIPTCPAAGRDTYTATYKVEAKPDHFYFFCQGHSHQDAPVDRPAYDSNTGLITN